MAVSDASGKNTMEFETYLHAPTLQNSVSHVSTAPLTSARDAFLLPRVAKSLSATGERQSNSVLVEVSMPVITGLQVLYNR